MGNEKCRKGNRTMMNGNYYHRTHKNHKPDTRGKVDHADNPANLFKIQNTDKEIKWVYSAKVTNESHIGYHQVIYALANHLLIYSVVKLKEWLNKDKTFNSLLKEDNLGRKYIVYSDYKKWAIANSKKLGLTTRQIKEIKEWILNL